jgi:putative membrane protein
MHPLCIHLLAHGDELIPQSPHDLWRAWEFDPGVVIALSASALLYGVGLYRLWRSGGKGRGIRAWEALSFAGGWLALVVALVSPLHPWGRALFAAHMTQHELLMLVAAPLLVLGRPVVAFLWAIPSSWSAALGRWSNGSAWRAVWGFFSSAMIAWLLHALILWMWHIPALFDATIDNDWVHAAQHTSFLLSAMLFWWAIMHKGQRPMGYGLAVLYLFTTALHSGLLGVLLTFARRLWYPVYQQTTQSWGLSPLQDQQLGGLVMWIPAGVVYIVAGLALFAGWLRESQRRVEQYESRLVPLPEAS